MVLCGVVPEIAWALVAEHLLRSFLFGVKALDPVVIAVSMAVLTATAAIAAMEPAWRAVRVDPIEVLRAE